MKQTHQFNSITVSYPNGEQRHRSISHSEIPDQRREGPSRVPPHGILYAKIAHAEYERNEFKKKIEKAAYDSCY